MGRRRCPEGEGSHLSFDGLRVVAFESRRSREIAELIRRHGGEPFSAPSMREIPLGENRAALDFARRLRKGEIDVVVLLTGVGTRHLTEAVAAELPPTDLGAALARIVTVARGPKPRAALRDLFAIAPTVSVDEPNTWRELLAAMDAHGSVAGRRIAVQEYGEPNPELTLGLEERGAEVIRVPVYRWALPEDLGPLEEAVRRILGGGFDVALFTSATQVEHLFRVAGDANAEPLAAAFARMVVASIGPIASEALRRRGIAVGLEPEHPKMGQLVLAAAERAPALLREKM